jgi:hypothetical protein
LARPFWPMHVTAAVCMYVNAMTQRWCHVLLLCYTLQWYLTMVK